MRGGHVDAISRRVVAGWAADSERPGQRLTVSVSVNGVSLGDAVADRLRNDLASLGRWGDGKHGFSFTFPEPLSADCEHVVRVVFKEDGGRLPNGEQRIAPAAPVAALAPNASLHATAPSAGPLAAAPGKTAKAPAAKLATAPKADALTPILVTAPGRSGTTLLMGLLARSPAIIAAELVPYELRLLSYHAAAYNVLTAPADLERSTHPDRLEGDGFHIGFNPFHSQQYAQAFRLPAPVRDYFDAFVPTQVAANARRMIEEFYGRLATDRGKTQARYFAEKGNNLHKPTREFTRRAFGSVRELVILRDPRDVLCSHMAYFSSSPEKGYTQLSHACRQLLSIRAEGRADTHWLKYEDMVRGDAACFSRLSAFLETPIEASAGDAGAAVFRRHATSLTPEASVARWRTNLPEDLAIRCSLEWADFLTEFGYAVA
jgi:hypothetical protein